MGKKPSIERFITQFRIKYAFIHVYASIVNNSININKIDNKHPTPTQMIKHKTKNQGICRWKSKSLFWTVN